MEARANDQNKKRTFLPKEEDILSFPKDKTALLIIDL
jgi:hypothetical protein